MAKKKKNGGQRDTRGYATSNSKPQPKPKPNASSQSKGGNVNTSKMAGKSVRKVQVSQSAQDQIASLLDELKQSLVSSSSFAGADDGGEKIGVRRRPIDFSVDDKKVVKKIAALVSFLSCLCDCQNSTCRCIVYMMFITYLYYFVKSVYVVAAVELNSNVPSKS